MALSQAFADDYNSELDVETEELLQSIIMPRLNSVFGEGHLFDPCLFGTLWDPSQPFPLWDFDDLEAIANTSLIDWTETDNSHILLAQLPGLTKNDIQVIVEDGSILEISGQWKKQNENSRGNGEERRAEWWEEGYVRRFKLPDNIDSDKIEAKIENGVLNVQIPKGKVSAKLPDQVKIIQLKD
ncbi:16.9 kDa class I heat shock protein 3 [Cryptomeria japonica]|uniref:16.9 kDa class I heat shock protein 3 n=1 Tax=Cryptomeria japonica TaxID=3369 RepID=UPI0025AD0080|nr:16.9 kDa class I heat shock protein 3 [Cryptomeria japonica]